MSVQSDALTLNESITLAIEEGASTIFDADGTVPVHIIRPGVGKGRGRHLYEAAMLALNAHKFNGWRMYVDHQSPEARKAAGGLPRSVRDLGGRIVESKWDPNVPADPARGYGQGAVVGRAMPVPFIRELIENDPQIIEASISASATAVKPVNHNGQRVWMVEGINDRGSVDWVTEAGAGGRVAPLIEASYASEEAVEMALLESMSDDEFVAYVHDARPGMQVIEADDDAMDEDDKDEPSAAVKKLMDKGMSRAQAEKFAANTKTQEAKEQEGDMPITPEQLQEALAESPEVLVEALKGNEAIAQYLNLTVQEALTDERSLQEAERDAVIDRQWELRDLRDEASTIITESKLPSTWQEGLRERFTLDAARRPTAELDLVDDIDQAGKVTKSAKEKLTEALNEAIKKDRRRLAEVAPTRVRGQGLSQLQEGDGEADDQVDVEPGYHRTLLAEAGIDYDKAYEGI
jgi:hypothetical protein